MKESKRNYQLSWLCLYREKHLLISDELNRGLNHQVSTLFWLALHIITAEDSWKQCLPGDNPAYIISTIICQVCCPPSVAHSMNNWKWSLLSPRHSLHLWVQTIGNTSLGVMVHAGRGSMHRPWWSILHSWCTALHICMQYFHQPSTEIAHSTQITPNPSMETDATKSMNSLNMAAVPYGSGTLHWYLYLRLHRVTFDAT